MAITFRRFNAQVKDPVTGNMVPAGLLSTDSLEAINSAKTTAVNTINAAGQAVEASLPQTWDDLNDTVSQMGSDLAFDENLINEGIFTITSDDLVSGTWSYGNPSSNSTRIRTKNAIPVRSGMTLTYTVGAYDIWYGVLETLESQSFLQGNQWDNISGTKTIKINVDGYLTFVVKDHRSTSISGGIDITPEDWDSTAVISIKGPVRGTIHKDGTDFNTIKLPGVYFITSAASSYANCPLPSTVSGTLEVFIGVANRTVQRITRMKNGDMYVRTANGLDSFEDVEWNYIPSRQQSPILAGTDLNTVTNVGIYFIGQAAADTYANCPLPANVAGTLEVFAGSSPFGSYLSLIQRLTRHTDGATYIRTSITGSFENRAWHCIEPSDKGAILNGTDFNNIVTEGLYLIDGEISYSYSNNPLPLSSYGILNVITVGGIVQQQVNDLYGGPTYIRAAANGVFANVNWSTVGFVNRGMIDPGTDFNSIKAWGLYGISSMHSLNCANNPLKNNVDGSLEVIRTGSSIVQRVTSSESDKGMYIRSSRIVGTVQTFSDVEWKYIPTEAEINQRLKFDENFISSGMYSVSASELVSGSWWNGTPHEDSTRARFPFLIPVYEGMRIDYEVADYDVFFGVLETPESNSYIQGGVWKSSSASNIILEHNGYLTIVFRSHSDSTASILPSNWNGSFTIYTPFTVWVTGPFTKSLEKHLVPELPQEPGNYVLKAISVGGTVFHQWVEA